MAERLYILLDIGNVILCLHFLYGKKLKINIQTILLVCSYVIIFDLINVYSVDRRLFWLGYLLIFVYTVAEFDIDKKRLIVSNMLYIIVLGLVQMFAVLLTLILRLSDLNDSGMAIFVQVIVCLTLLLGRNILKALLEYVLKRNPIIIGIGIAYFIAFVYEIARYKDEMEISVSQFLFLLIFGSLICTLAYCWQREKEISYRTEMDLRMHELYDDSFNNLIDTIRRKQHEYHNHMQAILSMHYTIHTYEELVREQEKYCNSLSEDNEYYRLLMSNCPVLTGFLYSKFVEADKRGINIEYSIAFNRRIPDIPEFIVIEILGILLDNAIEAVEGMKDSVIYVKIAEEEKFIIDICNPIESISYREMSRFFEKGYSSKTGHAGLGLSKIAGYRECYGFENAVEKREIEGRECFAVIITI